MSMWLPRIVAVLILPLLAGSWVLATEWEIVNPALFPSLGDTAEAMRFTVTSDDFASHLVRTLIEILGGFLLGSAIGVAAGYALTSSDLLRRAYFPLVSGFVSIPYVIFTPIIITWLGFGPSSKIAIAALVAFFPVLISTMAGLETSTKQELALMASLRASKGQIFWQLKVRNALPAIFGGLKVAMTLAIVGAVVGEFIGSDGGLGYLLMLYRGQFDVAGVYALILIFALIAVLAFALIEFIERRVVFWRSTP